MTAQTPLLSLIVVTMRPAFLPAVRAMLDRQTYKRTEIVVALHGHKVIGLLPEQRLALEGARAVLELPEAWSLGRCLNAAIAEAGGIFVAKIDDDDLYGREYLTEAVGHLIAEKGDVVGKAETFFYLEESGTILLRRPGLSHKTVKFVHGATLVFSRSLARHLPFRDFTFREGQLVLEDTLFLEDCNLGGTSVYSSSRRHFMGFRRAAKGSHTWTKPDTELIKDGIAFKKNQPATRAELLALID